MGARLILGKLEKKWQGAGLPRIFKKEIPDDRWDFHFGGRREAGGGKQQRFLTVIGNAINSRSISCVGQAKGGGGGMNESMGQTISSIVVPKIVLKVFVKRDRGML